jgi:SAM-dependent methyltransferase
MIVHKAKQWLSHPLTRGLDLDDPRTTEQRRRVLDAKPFLRRIYQEWYKDLVSALPVGDNPVLEIGSGAGFLSDVIPGLITSDILTCECVNVVLDAGRLPFRDRSLRAIVMTNVLHHLPRPRLFFREAGRCVRPGGAIVMIEPWVSSWSRFVYARLHHERFEPAAREWESPPGAPLSGGNGALPWIMFARDKSQFEREFPEWEIQPIRIGMPFRYLVSGGVSIRNLMPVVTFSAWQRLEQLIEHSMARWAMFGQITLTRRNVCSDQSVLRS